MSLLNFSPTSTPAPKAPTPVLPPFTRPIVVDNQERPVAHLQGYIEGMRCVVNYYSGVRDGTQATYGVDVGKSALLEQYRKIKRLEIVLDGDITHDQQGQDKTFTISGSGFVPFGVVPNEGDVFSMDVGDGRVGVMQVNSSSRPTALNDSVYQIQFTLLFYAADAVRFNDLESKVVQELNFLRDYAQFGKNPVVTDSVFADLKALSKLHENLINDYLRAFTHHNTKLLMMNGQTNLVHDPHTALAFRALVSTRRNPEIMNLRFVKDGVDDQQDQPTLWDVLLERRSDLLVGCRSESRAMYTASFPRLTTLRSLRYCGAQQIVFPYSPTTSLEDRYEGSEPWEPTEVFSPHGPLSEMDREGEVEAAVKMLPGLHPVCKDGHYILSRAFYYNDAPNMSLLEKLVWDYLEGESVSSRSLHYLASNHRSWGATERYFYVPIVIILINALLLDAG